MAKAAPLGSAAVIALALLGCSGDTASACPPKFDSAAWKQASRLEDEGEPVRRELAGQLERCDFIDKASKGRVGRLLGSPIPEIERTRSWMYYLGEPAWGIDSDWLYIEFSRRNRVEAVEINQG